LFYLISRLYSVEEVTPWHLPHSFGSGGTVPLIILISLLLIMSWLFSEVLVLFPVDILNSLKPFTSLTLIVALLAFLWCFGE